MKKNKSKISGLSILEALVSTAIVGIGFIAILQMTNFSVQSIDNSGDRTKANYLAEMIAEDVIGSKNTLYGTNSDNENIVFNQDGSMSFADGSDASGLKKFSEHLNTNGWNASLNCGKPSTGSGDTNTEGSGNTNTDNIYQTQNNDAPRNKEAKWDMIFNENRFLKCKSNNETKKLETFKVCKWDCTLKNDFVFDDPIYISRVEMLLNNGKKKKHLYFQSDYNIKITDTDPDGDDGEGETVETPGG